MINWKEVNAISIGRRFETSIDAIGLSPLFKSILENKNAGCLSKIYQEGYSEQDFSSIVNIFSDLKGRKVFEGLNHGSEEHMFVWDDAIIELTCNRAKTISVNSASVNNEITAAVKTLIKSFSTPAKKGFVFAITRGSSGLALTRIGYAGSPIERGNYTEDVIKDYDFVIDDLKSKDPTGRIVILEGSAGSGKTFYTRAILTDVPNALFVIVPPNMVSSLGGPELIPLLSRTKDDYGKSGSIILVLEDADAVLAPRAADNMSSISSILNMSDGILGSLFDIRIVATTNAKVKDFDKAIVRDMRLSKRVSFQPHSYKFANSIYKRLMKNNDKDMPAFHNSEQDKMKPISDKNVYTLAEIYKQARNLGWKPEKMKEEVANVYDDHDLPPYYGDENEFL